MLEKTNKPSLAFASEPGAKLSGASYSFNLRVRFRPYPQILY
jgi:hypothetical protein